MNKSDSERIAQVLESMGYERASKENEADLLVVNMCSVRQSAVDRVYGMAKKFAKLKTQNSKLKTILTGCILKQDKKKLAKNFDFILKIKDLPKWPNLLSNFFYDRRKCSTGEYWEIEPKYSNNYSAFVPISNGCNFNCAYCVIPFTRGRLVCRPHQEILNEVKKVVKKGFKEIWLLGQNVNDYKSKLKSQNSKVKIINFAKLLKMVNDIPGDFWIRFTSPHPSNFSDELIKTMAKCQKVTPYLNLPLQSGDDEVLKRMNRNYTTKDYENLVKKIRQAFKKYRKGIEKEVAISTDIIVGFPGETKKQFENTVKFFKKIKFDMAYIAKFSPRPGTVAEKIGDNVPQKEKERRYKILTNLLKKIAKKKNEKFLNKVVDVLVEEEKDGFLLGKSRHFKTVKFKGEKDLVGNFVKVKILKVEPFGLFGKLIK